MLAEICRELRNWFDRGQRKVYGTFDIINCALLDVDDILKIGQYYRIVGSLFNDGIHKYMGPGISDETLIDESFEGAIWPMAIPQAFLNLVDKISAWTAKYGDIDSTAMSPYASESFGGYSYSKASSDSGGGADWRKQFSSELQPWRKI